MFHKRVIDSVGHQGLPRTARKKGCERGFQVYRVFHSLQSSTEILLDQIFDRDKMLSKADCWANIGLSIGTIISVLVVENLL